MNPRSSIFKLSFCIFTCLSNNSPISSWILYQSPMYALPVKLFQPEVRNTCIYLHCRLIVAPTNDLHKLSDTQSILMYVSLCSES